MDAYWSRAGARGCDPRDDRDPVERVEEALQCLAPYDPSRRFASANEKNPFLYWKILDFAHACRSGITTPSAVAEHVIAGVEEWNNKKPPMPMLIYFDAHDLTKQADASTKRFEQGATTFFDKIRPVEKDAVLVARLRKCGVIFIGKANMHELGIGVIGNNPNYHTGLIHGVKDNVSSPLQPITFLRFVQLFDTAEPHKQPITLRKHAKDSCEYAVWNSHPTHQQIILIPVELG
uniref:Amidase domain-containing protein n=1 Tax=Aegilops tauschii TaxID=37682 RepID=M8AXT7_AEGTA